jgi:GNAT superfamily N-acetyltransferase
MSMQAMPVRFTKEQIGRVQDFVCGTEPHQTPLADWIKNHSLVQLKNGTKIWLYETDCDMKHLIGYGSLGKAKWNQPRPDGNGVDEVKVVCLPNFAVHRDFWGKPEGAPREERFSYQIIKHLQIEAVEMLHNSPVLKPLLILYVHPGNEPAKKLYSNCGFSEFPLTKHDPATGAEGQCMVYRLD